MSAATNLAPTLRMVLKLRPGEECDYCGRAAHPLFACMGEEHCEFCHGCATCLRRHIATRHSLEERYAVEVAS